MLASFAAAESSNIPKIPLAWFEEADQHAPHWDVTLGPPTLLYSQRLLIHANAVLPARVKKEERKADWFLVLRVADGQGKWFPGSDYAHIEWTRVPPKVEQLMWNADFFARPGNYQLVLLAYDLTTEKHYVWRKAVTLETPDALPDLDRDMPQVEFIDPSQPHAPLGEFLPIRNRKPLRVDVVLNLTGELQLGLHADIFSVIRQRYVEGTLQGAAGMFSQLKPDAGCVRLSAIDILHLATALDRAKAEPESDWRTVRSAIVKNRDASTVDVRTLTGRTRAREYFHKFLDGVIADGSGCGEAGHNVERAIVVVSDSLEFPKGNDRDPVTPPEVGGARIFLVRISSRLAPVYDQVGHMLNPLHPRKFDVNSPQQLRHAVAEIIRDIETSTVGGSTSD